MTDMLATISKASEDIQQQGIIFSEPKSIKQRETLAKSIASLEAKLTSVDAALEVRVPPA
jgi:hypothetical protein